MKRGGELVYSTCSIFEKENAGALRQVLTEPDAEVIPLEMPADIPVFPRTDGAVCVKPSVNYEGFFLAKIRKKG